MICMAKQKYSAAVAFHIWLLPFTSCPRARPQHKSKEVRQHHPAGHQLGCSELLQLYLRLFFSFFNTESCYFLSLPSFCPSPFSSLEASREGFKVMGACRRGEWVMPPVWGLCGPPPPPPSRHSRLICSFLFTANEAPSFQAAWSSPPPPHDTHGCTRKYFPSDVFPLSQAHSACKWNKDGCTTSGICTLPRLALVTTDRKTAPWQGSPHPRCCVA